jgi:hypothetical protein
MNHRIFATDGFCLIIMLFLVRLLAMLDPLRHVHDVFAHETETKPDLTNLLSTKAMTVDIAFLGKVYNTTSNLIEATKDFYIEHFPANHFRTQDLSINNRSMDDIRPTLDYVVKVTSLDPDIDPSACAFHKDTISAMSSTRNSLARTTAPSPSPGSSIGSTPSFPGNRSGLGFGKGSGARRGRLYTTPIIRG